MVFSHFLCWLLTSHLGFSSPCCSILRSDNRHVGSGGSWILLHSNCFFHHFLRFLHHCYRCLVTWALFLKKQAKKNNFPLLASWHTHLTDSIKQHVLPNNLQIEIQKKKNPVSQKTPAMQLCWYGWAQFRKWKSCECAVMNFVFIGNPLLANRRLPYI